MKAYSLRSMAINDLLELTGIKQTILKGLGGSFVYVSPSAQNLGKMIG